jgi:hypothetical protein
MEENQILISLITGLVIIGICLAIYARMGGDFLGGGDTTEWGVNNMTSKLIITKTSGDVGIEAIRGDNYYYKITAMPKLSVLGDEEADVIAVVEFKGTSVKGKFETQMDFADKIHVVPRDSLQPKIIAEMYSEVPPISEFSSNPFHKDVQVFIKSQSAAPLLITLVSMEEKRDIMANSVLNMLKKKCYAKFELKCEGLVAYTSSLTACVEGEDYKCEQNVEMCGSNVKVNILDEPDCGSNTANVDIRYDGKEIFEVTESVWVSLWKDSECTKVADIRLLMGKCLDDYLGRFELESSLITVG